MIHHNYFSNRRRLDLHRHIRPRLNFRREVFFWKAILQLYSRLYVFWMPHKPILSWRISALKDTIISAKSKFRRIFFLPIPWKHFVTDFRHRKTVSRNYKNPPSCLCLWHGGLIQLMIEIRHQKYWTCNDGFPLLYIKSNS